MTTEVPTTEPLTPAPPSRLTVWAETAVIAAAVPAIGWWLQPADPFFVRGPIGWPLLAPMLAGLRYGFVAGFGCAAALLLSMAGAGRMRLIALDGASGQYAVALLLAGMIAGQFADLWSGRVRRIAAVSAYQRLRFEEFARSYHLLKVSHDAVEERSAASTSNLRNALAAARVTLLGSKDGLAGAGAQVLELFAAFARVQAAALLPVDAGGRVGAPVATLGAMSDAVGEDPLVHEALRSGAVAAVSGGADPGERRSALLAAVPCVDVEGRTWAVVAVRDLPFVAFTPETLRLCALIAAHLADTLAFGEPTAGGARSLRAFERQAQRCLEDARRHRVPASLVEFAAADMRAAARALAIVVEERRGLDVAIAVQEAGGGCRVFVLLPLTDAQGLDGYLARLERMVRLRHGSTLEHAGVQVAMVGAIQGSDGARILSRLRALATPVRSLDAAG